MKSPRARTARAMIILGAALMATLSLLVVFSGVRAAPRAFDTETLERRPPLADAPQTTWSVCATGCDFELINDALNDARVVDGDTIWVLDNVHTESEIFVGKDVTIRGQGPQNTIVQARSTPPEAGGSWGGVFIVLEEVQATIAGMTVRHGSRVLHWSIYEEHVHSSNDEDASVAIILDTNIDSYGAGILVAGGDLRLENSVVSDNYIIMTETVRMRALATAPLTATAEALAQTRVALYGRGAGIFNAGNLTVTNSTIMNNQVYLASDIDVQAEASGGVFTQTAAVRSRAHAYGAGIYNAGSMWLTNSTVSGNEARTSATAHAGHEVENLGPEAIGSAHGAVRRFTGEHAVEEVVEEIGSVTRLTILNVEEGQALPLDESSATAEAESWTVGGIYNEGTATVAFATIAGNSTGVETDVVADGEATTFAEQTGGVWNEAGALILSSTLIAAQGEGGNCGGSVASSQGHNLEDDGSCMLAGSGDLSNVDAMLAPLGDYGGETPTHALLHGSPAVDAGDAACDGSEPEWDQRGVARPVDGNADGEARCDIGAVEAVFEADLSVQGSMVGETQVDGAPGNSFVLAPDAVTAGAWLTYSWPVRNEGPYPAGPVLLELMIPAALEAEGAAIETTAGSCDAALPADRNDPLQCALGSVAAGDVVTVSVAARAAPSTPEGTTLSGTAFASTNTVDAEATNNGASLDSAVSRSADVAVTYAQTPSIALVGNALTYTLTVENVGPSDAAVVSVTNALPAGTGAATWTCAASQGASCAEGGGSGALAQEVTLPAGETVTYTINTTVVACMTQDSAAHAETTGDPYAANDSASTSNAMNCLFIPSLRNGAP